MEPMRYKVSHLVIQSERLYIFLLYKTVEEYIDKNFFSSNFQTMVCAILLVKSLYPKPEGVYTSFTYLSDAFKTKWTGLTVSYIN